MTPNLDKIVEHYNHAREKHPHFIDYSPLTTTNGFKKKMTGALRIARETLKIAGESNELEWIDVFDCEKFEALVALASGDKTQAVEELYDCVAVLLRTIDLLEGRQKLGKPEEEGEAK